MSDEYKSPSDSKIQLMLILTLTPGRNDRYSYQGQSKNQSLVRNYNLVSHLPKMIGSKFFFGQIGFPKCLDHRGTVLPGTPYSQK